MRHLQHTLLLTLASACGLLSTCPSTFAQSVHPFLGRWTVNWEGKSRPQQAVLEITADGGRWQTLDSKKNDRCVGLAAPIEIQHSSAKEIQFSIRFSTALQGCPDSNVKLQLHEDGSVTGERSGDRALTLQRK